MKRNKINLLTLAISICLLLSFQLGMAQEKEAPKQVLITNVSVWDGTSDEVKKSMYSLKVTRSKLLPRVSRLMVPS